jgi:hypothetical protein
VISSSTAPIPIGSLIRDVDQGDIGIVVGPLEVSSLGPAAPICRWQLVLWPANSGVPVEMDLSAIKSGWVEVISESR